MMSIETNVWPDDMRVTIMRGGSSVWAKFHKAGARPHSGYLTIFLSDDRPAELAAWEALSAALAAQGAPVKEEA